MSKSVKPRIIIVDPSLKDERGHHYALTKAVSMGAVANEVQLIWLANKEFAFKPEIENVRVRPLFSASMYDAFKKSKNAGQDDTSKREVSLVDIGLIERIPQRLRPLLRKIRNWLGPKLPDRYHSTLGLEQPASVAPKTFVEELLSGLESENVTAADQVLFHTADGDTYRAILEIALTQSKFLQGPCYHVCTPYDSEIMPHNKKGLSAARVAEYLKLLGALERKVLLYGENIPLAEHLSEEWGVKVRPLEIPPPVTKVDVAINADNKNGRLEVVYLGAAREEKGFHLLPDVVQQVAAINGAGGDIHFTLQCSPQIIGYMPIIKKAIARLKEQPGELLSLIETQQSMDDYYTTLKSADVVLLCYQSDKYRVRGSGIAVEAVAFGKIVIATPNTFPASVASAAAVTGEGAKDIAEKLVTIAKDKKSYIERAKIRQREYCQKNSPEKYIRRVLDNGRAVQSSLADNAEINYQSELAHIFDQELAPGADIHLQIKRLLDGGWPESDREKAIKLPRLVKVQVD
jgi:glycosyltransferase involved in cell wall biosynthesis